MNGDEQDPEQPVAYTADGQPLYAHPPAESPPPSVAETFANHQNQSEMPGVESKPLETPETESDQTETALEQSERLNAIDPDNPGQLLSAEQIQQKHAESAQQYPFIQFLPDEYVVIDVARTSWGYLKNWLGAFLALLLLVAILVGLTIAKVLDAEMFFWLTAIGAVALLLAFSGAALAMYIFKKNRFIITNERVFRRLQLTPFSYNDQNIELSRIEDCSFQQSGLVQEFLDYGTIVLETVGHEKTYRFDFASNPKDQFQIINMMVEEAGSHGGEK